MTHRLFLILPLLLVFLFPCPCVTAQNAVVLRIDDATVASGERLCVPILTDTFDNIAAVQLSVAWDSLLLEFEEVDFGTNNPLPLNEGNTNRPSADNFVLTFTTNDLSGITLAPGDTLMTLCFTAMADNETITHLGFAGMLPPEFVQEDEVVAAPFDTIPATITVTAARDTSTSVTATPAWGREVTIYPNPYRGGTLSIQGTVPALEEVSLLSADGRLVYQRRDNVRRIEDLPELPVGTYTLRLRARDGVVAKRLVVVR